MIPTPNLLDLLQKKIGSTSEDEVRQFFAIKRKPTDAWVQTLVPGLDAAAKLLTPYLAEQQSGNANAPAETDERDSLCIYLFGSNYLEALRKLRDAVKGNDRTTITFDKIEDGRLRISVNHGLPAAPAPVEPPRQEPIEGLIPAVREPTNRLEALIESLRPRVRLLPEQNDDLENLLAAVLEGRWARKVSMLLPVYGEVNMHVAYHWMAQIRRQPWLGMHYETNSVIQRARNVLVAKFLASESEWSLWLDSDIVAPFGDPAFFYDHERLCADPTFLKPQFTAVMAVERLLKAQKTIVGGVYQARRAGSDAPLIIQPCLHPRDAKDREITAELRRSGPIDRVMQVGYVATGCALMHRSVFRDIQNKFPERQPADPKEPYDFFGHDVGVGGEDIAFGALAQQAGHASHLDLGLWCGHLGTQAFFPQRAV